MNNWHGIYWRMALWIMAENKAYARMIVRGNTVDLQISP